jgi:hypothetical protein
MNPDLFVQLQELRAHELQKEAEAQRLARNTASKWDHPWRRGLGRLADDLRGRVAGRRPRRSPLTSLQLGRYTGARV